MEQSDITTRLEAIISRLVPLTLEAAMLGPRSAPKPPQLDISKPNLHDSKAEFIEEKAIVEAALSCAQSLLEHLKPLQNAEHPANKATERVVAEVNREILRHSRPKRSGSAFQLAYANALDSGATQLLTVLLRDLISGLDARKQELAAQEATFWNTAGRAPNHYARTIALRLARLVARVTGKKPTFGTARDGGHPSTEFGRALEEVFAVLEIRADVRNAARWAIDQLTEEDLTPEARGASMVFGINGLVGVKIQEKQLVEMSGPLKEGH